MTDEIIDRMSGEELSIAIAEAMEPKPESFEYGYRGKSSDAGWWVLSKARMIFSGEKNGPKWVVAKGIYSDGGNIADALLQQVWKWGWRWSMEQTDSGVHAFAFHPDFDGMDVLSGTGLTLPMAVARLFLRVSEARKEK